MMSGTLDAQFDGGSRTTRANGYQTRGPSLWRSVTSLTQVRRQAVNGGEAVCREALDEAVGQSLDDGEAVVNQLMVMGRLVMKPLVRKRLVVWKLFIVVKHLTYWSGIHRVLYSAVTSCFW